jgi:hypothetical protein
VTKLTIQDESLWSCGDLKEYFKFDILSDCKEQVPVHKVMTILMIHHMVVEVFFGRVLSGHWFIVVECGMGGQHQISPINTEKGGDMNLGKEEDKGVMELRKMLRE